MRIAIFGSGGVGGYFGARLAQARQEVIFIARGSHLETMRKIGLQVDSIAGNMTLKRVDATDDPAQVGEVDFIICGVKAWQVISAATAMRRRTDVAYCRCASSKSAFGRFCAAPRDVNSARGICRPGIRK